MIKFTPEEKQLILAAINYEKILQGRADDEEIEWVEEIEEEIGKENIFLSRHQLDSIVIYLAVLLDHRDLYDSGSVLALESKIEYLSNLT